jgi:hypothetical protein
MRYGFLLLALDGAGLTRFIEEGLGYGDKADRGYAD